MGQWAFDYLKSEWTTVVKAPAIVVVVLIFGIGIGWFAAGVFYQQDLQTMRDQVGNLQIKLQSPTPLAVPTAVMPALGAASPMPSPSQDVQNILEKMGGQITNLKDLNGHLGWPKNKQRTLKEIWNAHIVGQNVPLDGYVYVNSTFDDVTFQYDGRLPSGGWVNSKISAGRFYSASPEIKTALIIVQSLNINPAQQCGIVAGAPPALK